MYTWCGQSTGEARIDCLRIDFSYPRCGQEVHKVASKNGDKYEGNLQPRVAADHRP